MKFIKLLSSRTRPHESNVIPDDSGMFAVKERFFNRCKKWFSCKRDVQASPNTGLDVESTTPCVSAPTLVGRIFNSYRTTPCATYPPSTSSDGSSRIHQRQPKALLSPMSIDLSLPDFASSPCTPHADEGLCFAQISEEHPMSNTRALQSVPASIAQSPVGLLPSITGQLPASPTTEEPFHLLPSHKVGQRVCFDSLPVEMLLEIFPLCMPLADWTRMTESHSCSSAFGAKSILRQVCKTWKNIVDDMCALVRVQIGVEDIGRVINIIQPAVFRPRTWNTLSVQIGAYWLQADLDMMNRMSSLFSQFQRIHITCHDIIPDPGLDLVHHTAESFSPSSSKPQNLHDFSWSSNYGIDDSLPPEWRLPWNQLWNSSSPNTGLTWSDLTCLCLDCPLSFDDCLNVLRVSTRLGSASFVRVSRGKETRQRGPNQPQLVSAASSSSNPIPPVHHAGLRTLKLGLVDEGIPFFKMIVLANLRSLDLHVDQLTAEILQLNPNPIPWTNLYDLSVQCDMSLADVRKFLVECPNLRNFQWRCLRTTTTSYLVDLCSTVGFSSFKLLRDSSTPDFAPLIACLDHQLRLTPILILPHIPLFIIEQLAVYPKITTFILTSAITMSQFFLICDACTGLEVLEVSLKADGSTYKSRKMCCLESLDSLSIYSTINLQPLFDCLELSKLTALQLRWGLGVSVAAGDGLESFLSRSGASLERLSLANRSIADITTCLMTVSASLMDLTIDNGISFASDLTVGNDLLRRLTHGSGGFEHCLCPKLNSITLSPLSSIDGVLAGMIRSRRSNNDTGGCLSCKVDSTFRDLDRVEVKFGPLHEDSHPTDNESLAVLAKQGLDL